MPYLYCFKLIGLFNNKDVYKFGKTNQRNPMQRLDSYNGLNKPKNIILISYVENCDLLETKILEELRNKYEFISDLGREYFNCNDEIQLHKFIKEMEIKYYNYEEEISDDEEASPSIRKIPIYIILNNIKNKLLNETWRELLIVLLQNIQKIKDIKLSDYEYNLIKNIKGKKNKYFSETNDELREPKIFLDGSKLYVETNLSSTAIINICNKIANLFEIDFDYITN